MTEPRPVREAAPATEPDPAGSAAPEGLNGALWRVLAAAGARAARWPWWLQVSALYLAARLVSACIFAGAALQQGVNPWFPPKPDYWNFINIWDARWYGEALRNGYPSTLPVDAAGNVKENAWAFYPLFPLLGRILSGLTGLVPATSLTLIASAAGLGAALVIYRLFRFKAGRRTALWGSVFVATFPVAPILQVPYAESLNLLLLAAALLLVLQRRYLWAMPVVLLMDLSRPTGVPFAAMLGLLFLHRLYAHVSAGRGHRPPSKSAAGEPADHGPAALWALAALTAVAGVGALLWPGIAWAVTGDIQAYTRTETVWRGQDLVPFKPWFDTGVQLFGPVLGLLAPLVFVALFALLMMSKPVVRLGSELRLWCVCYVGYLLMFLYPQTSTFRMLLPLFPLALGAAWISRSRAYRGAVIVMFLLLQLVWVVWLWAWAQLPGGGDYPP